MASGNNNNRGDGVPEPLEPNRNFPRARPLQQPQNIPTIQNQTVGGLSLVDKLDQFLSEQIVRNFYSDISQYPKTFANSSKGINKQLQDISQDSLFRTPADINELKEWSHTHTSRQKIYSDTFTNPKTKAPQGGIRQLSNDSPGPLTNPPASLMFRGDSDKPAKRNLYVPKQGLIRKGPSEAHSLGNLYDDAGLQISDRGGQFSLAGSIRAPIANSLRFVDPFAIANWLRNIGREFGVLPIQDNNSVPANMNRPTENIVKGIFWPVSQFLLTALNPTDTEVGGLANAIWNPLSLPTSAIPFERGSGLDAITVGAATGLGVYQPETSRIDKYTTEIRAAELNYSVRPGGKPEDVLKRPEQLGIFSKLPDLFKSSNQFPTSGIETIKASVSILPPVIPKDTPQLLDARIWEAQEKNGVLENPPADDEIYMPFAFQDLRESPPKFLYFRAFLREGFSETFTPDWQVDRYYGRVDQIPTYRGTIRTINLAFDVVAWAPVDLPVIYKKLHKLQSMVYPSFDTKGFLQAAPIIRMRVGDLISSKKTFTANTTSTPKVGLPGYFTSLDFSYDETVWNLELDFKVPRKVTVSLGFNVIHEGNPGLYPFKIFQEGGTADDNLTFGCMQEVGELNTFQGNSIEKGGPASRSIFKNFEDQIRGVVGKVDEYYKTVFKEGLT